MRRAEFMRNSLLLSTLINPLILSRVYPIISDYMASPCPRALLVMLNTAPFEEQISPTSVILDPDPDPTRRRVSSSTSSLAGSSSSSFGVPSSSNLDPGSASKESDISLRACHKMVKSSANAFCSLDRSPTIQSYARQAACNNTEISSNTALALVTEEHALRITKSNRDGHEASIIAERLQLHSVSKTEAADAGQSLLRSPPSNKTVSPSKWDDADNWVFNQVDSSESHDFSKHPFSNVQRICNIQMESRAARATSSQSWDGHYSNTGMLSWNISTSICKATLEPVELLDPEGIDRPLLDRELKPGQMEGPRWSFDKGRAMSALERSHYVQTDLIAKINTFLGGQEIISEASGTKTAISSYQNVTRSRSNSIASIESTVKSSNQVTPVHSPMKKVEFLVHDPSQIRSTGAMKDAATDITPCASHRDMGTQVTPLPSTCATPSKHAASPPRHNTPVSGSDTACTNSCCMSDSNSFMNTNELASIPHSGGKNHHRHHSNKPSIANNRREEKEEDEDEHRLLRKALERSVLMWSSEEEEEEDKINGRQCNIDDLRSGFVEARACAWEEAERSKCNARYEREEAKIDAWENHQKAKAEVERRKFEVKLERMRSHMNEKITRTLGVAHRQAEEMRASARAQHLEKLGKARKRADRIRRTTRFPSNLACGCFSCTDTHC